MATVRTNKPNVKSEVKEVENTSPSQELTVAVVLNGKYEVRRYTLEEHGQDFAELANEFAAKRKYTVQLEEAKVGIKCPSCGHVFSP